ncbi:MAG: hypothetical protein ACRDN0_13305 [Trebonia sp.]
MAGTKPLVRQRREEPYGWKRINRRASQSAGGLDVFVRRWPWARYVIRMEPFASAPRSQVAAWVGPTVQAYITGRLGAHPDPTEPGPG